ncbi:MAG: DUF6340 family protein [Candidatus Azobacteroides sp.]|nr:DUF6340 family protein [Candidatus Azobacteroides sp.]
MVKNKILFFLILHISFLTGCDTVSYIQVNVKEPANIVLPSEIQHIVVKNNIQEKNETHSFIYNKEEKILEVQVDSIPELICQSLWNHLEDEHFFESVSHFRTSSFTENIPFLYPDIKNILSEIETDGIISLDLYQVSSTLTLEEITDYSIIQATYEINTKALFNIFSEDGLKVNSVLVNDTIFWDEYGIDAGAAVARLPYLEDALLTAAERTGEIAMKKIIPHWITEYRRYYSSQSGKMKKAAAYVKKDNWEAAFEMWKKIYADSNSLSQRAQCAANIALYYELQNQFDLAVSWATQSLEEFNAAGSKKEIEEVYYLNDYIKRLSNRKKENYFLDLQENNKMNEVNL